MKEDVLKREWSTDVVGVTELFFILKKKSTLLFTFFLI